MLILMLLFKIKFFKPNYYNKKDINDLKVRIQQVDIILFLLTKSNENCIIYNIVNFL